MGPGHDRQQRKKMPAICNFGHSMNLFAVRVQIIGTFLRLLRGGEGWPSLIERRRSLMNGEAVIFNYQIGPKRAKSISLPLVVFNFFQLLFRHHLIREEGERRRPSAFEKCSTLMRIIQSSVH